MTDDWRVTEAQRAKLLRRAEQAGWPALVIDSAQRIAAGEASWRQLAGLGLSAVMGEKLWRALYPLVTAISESKV